MAEMSPKPKRVRVRRDILAVSLPLDTRAALVELAAAGDMGVSAFVTAIVDLGHAARALEEIKLLSGARQIPENVRVRLAKLPRFAGASA